MPKLKINTDFIFDFDPHTFIDDADDDHDLTYTIQQTNGKHIPDNYKFNPHMR